MVSPISTWFSMQKTSQMQLIMFPTCSEGPWGRETEFRDPGPETRVQVLLNDVHHLYVLTNNDRVPLFLYRVPFFLYRVPFFLIQGTFFLIQGTFFSYTGYLFSYRGYLFSLHILKGRGAGKLSLGIRGRKLGFRCCLMMSITCTS